MWDRVGATLLFGLAANTDNVSIGLAYGLTHRRIRWHSNVLIAVITTLITLAALAGGLAIRRVIPPRMTDLLGGLCCSCWQAGACTRSNAVSTALASERWGALRAGPGWALLRR